MNGNLFALTLLKMSRKMTRPSARTATQLRPISIQRHYTRHAEGSVPICFGDTKVLSTARVENRVPGFLRGILEDIDLGGVYKRWNLWQPQTLDAGRLAVFERGNRLRRFWLLRGYPTLGNKQRNRKHSDN